MQPQPSLMSQLTNSMATGGSPLNIQSPGSPMAQPGLSPPQPSPMPNKTFHLEAALKRRGMTMPASIQGGAPPPPPMPQDPSQAQGQPPQVAQPAPAEPTAPLSEVELIIKALSHHLDHKGKMEAKVLEAALPQDQTPLSSPQQ